MSALRTKRDGVHAAEGAIASYNEQRASLASVAKDTRARHDGIAEQLEAQYAEIAAGLLPFFLEGHVLQVAAQLEVPELHATWQSLTTKARERGQRIRAIEADPAFQNRDRDLPALQAERAAIEKRFAQEKQYLESRLAIAEGVVQTFERDAQFMRCYRGRHRTAWSVAWDVVLYISIVGILVILARDARQRSVCVRHGVSGLHVAFAAYEAEVASVRLFREQLHDLHTKYVQELTPVADRVSWILVISDEHAEHMAAALSHVDQGLTWLREIVAQSLRACMAFEELRAKLPAPLRTHASTVIVLRKKREYLASLLQAVARDMGDCDTRVVAIDRVRHKWSRKPSGTLRGDKEHWLVTTPQAKAAGTAKRVRSYRSMADGFYAFDDYDLVDYLLDRQIAYLMYDVLFWGAAERLPYEAFAAGVIDEIGTYREEHGQSGADYSAFDGYAARNGVSDDSGEAALAVAAADTGEQPGDVLDDDIAPEASSPEDFADIS